MDTENTNTPLDVNLQADPMTLEERADALFPSLNWHAYKGHNRGGLTGLAFGGLVGLLAGAAVLGVLLLAHVALPALALFAIPAALAGSASVIGWDAFSSAGSATASRAAALAEEHVRKKDPLHLGDALSALDDQLMSDGRGHHYEFPPDRDKGKTFYWKSGLVGAAVAAAVGALAGFSPEFAGPIVSLIQKIPGIGAGLVSAVGPAGLVAATSAFGGLSFGIDRSHFKSLHNHTDALIHNKIVAGEVDISKIPALQGKSPEEIMELRLKRQEEAEKLEKYYSKKIFQSGVDGYLRGTTGGAVVGALTGGALGLLACGAMALFAGPAVAMGIAGYAVMATFAAAGTTIAMKIFSDSGTQAGAESMARAIDTKFDRDQVLISKGITPTKEVESESKKEWFNGKNALIAGVLGAVIGVVVAPVLGVGVLTTIGLTSLAAAAAPALTIPVSAAVSGVGAMTAAGIGSSVIKRISHAADWLYDTSYFNEDDKAKPGNVLKEDAVVAAPVRPNQISQEEAEALDRNLNANKGVPNFEQTLIARDKMNNSLNPSPRLGA